MWVCTSCTAAYSIGAPRCPQCGDTGYVPAWEEDQVAKITVHGGPSNAPDGLGPADAAPAPDEPDVVPADGAVSDAEGDDAPAAAPRRRPRAAGA